MTSKEYSTIDNNNKDTEELVELQNENAQLNLELCTLHTNYENLELENIQLKEEIASLKEKIKNLEEYIDKIEEDDIVENTQINTEEDNILSTSNIQEETDINVLKHKIMELQKEIIRLSDNIKEDLINNKNMQNEYESQIEVLKNDITALENENDQLRQEINDIKDKNNTDIKNCLEEIAIIKTEKDQEEQKYIEKLEELNLIIKKYQNKIIEQENAYKSLCDTSENKLKETYDKFTEEIKNIKNSQNQYDNMDGFSVSEMNLEIHNLKTENFELKKNLEKFQSNFTQKQKENSIYLKRKSNNINLNFQNQIEEIKSSVKRSSYINRKTNGEIHFKYEQIPLPKKKQYKNGKENNSRRYLLKEQCIINIISDEQTLNDEDKRKIMKGKYFNLFYLISNKNTDKGKEELNKDKIYLEDLKINKKEENSKIKKEILEKERIEKEKLKEKEKEKEKEENKDKKEEKKAI